MLSQKYFPDYQILVIEHIPQYKEPIKIAAAAQDEVRSLLYEQQQARKYEYSSTSYQLCIFPVSKKSEVLHLVIDLQDLNAVTIYDSTLPLRLDDFTESFVGCTIYGVADLLAGFNTRTFTEESRDLTTFHSLISLMCITILLQGYTNSMPEF